MAPTAADRAAAILREVQSAGEVTVEELVERPDGPP
jgi:DeoR/GlpR family transcriptional regulator of sugar metabolism